MKNLVAIKYRVAEPPCILIEAPGRWLILHE
jgi:hypothetical protein